VSRRLLALAAAQVASTRAGERHATTVTRAIVGTVLAYSVRDATTVRRGPAALAVAAVVGMAAEHVGTRTGRPFGRYAYSGHLGPKPGGVPLLAGAAWAMMARPAWVVAGRIDRRRVPRVALAAGALTAWDVFLDPRMVRDGYWTWAGGGRYEDVPLSNFLGWWLTGCAVFGGWTLLGPGDEPEDEAMGLYLWTWVGETIANAVVWRRPRVAVAGAAAMGAFAVPALVRR
jgi:putative membrane protein